MTESLHPERVSETFPVPDGELDLYFRNLTRGVSLRRMVEVRPGMTWQNRDAQEELAQGHSLITFNGLPDRVNDFKEAVSNARTTQGAVRATTVVQLPK